MDEMTAFRRAATDAALGPRGPSTAVRWTGPPAPRLVVLVEGTSDRVALETLADHTGRDLDAEGVCVLPIGGATGADRHVRLLGSEGLGITLAGLCDEAEERFFQRAVQRASGRPGLDRDDMRDLGFFVCRADLEDELIRALGVDRVQSVLADEGDLRRFRIFQRQPDQRGRPLHRQLRRFLGTISGRKEHYARSLTTAMEPGHLPAPLEDLLDRVCATEGPVPRAGRPA